MVNLRHLEAHSIHLEGELSVAELDIDTRDQVIQVTQPLQYNLEVEKIEDGLLLLAHNRLRCVSWSTATATITRMPVTRY